jgi:hypothetical protein
MSTTTTLAPVVAPAEVDPAVAAGLCDDILLNAVREEKVEKVPVTGRTSSMQSHTARAWTMSGHVD